MHTGVVGGRRTGTPVQHQLPSEELNRYFVSVGPRVAAEVAERARGAVHEVACRLPRVGACGFQVSPIDLDTLASTILSMRNSPARGADGLCVRTLKAAFPAVGFVILHIINTCLVFSDYPESWKHSLIHPILKGGDPCDPSNFRPISITPIISKVVEKVMQRQLYHQQLADYSTLCLAQSLIERDEPSSLAAAFRLNSEVRERSTRQDGRLNVPRSRTETGKRRFSVRAPTLNNRLPNELSSVRGQL